MVIFDAVEIQRIIPHRPPFLLVDKIIEFEPRRRIVGVKQVTINEFFFQGHFPENPVMPGVLIIEALAQVGAILALKELPNRADKIPLFSGIESARFRHPVFPGDTLWLEVTATRVGTKVQKMHGTAKVEEQIVAEAEIMCVIGELNKESNRVKRNAPEQGQHA